MKKITSIALCAALAVSMVGCGSTKSESASSQNMVGTDSSTWGPPLSSETTSGDTQIANPFVDFNDLSGAEGLAGFKMEAPESIDGYPEKMYQAIDKQLVQIFYYSEDKQEQVLVRKVVGEEDSSGVYTVYDKTESVTQDGIEVTLKGNEDKVSLATWVNEGYAYSVMFSASTDKENMLKIVAETK